MKPSLRDVKLFSYVVHHDRGYAPNPYFEFCTLCRCKYRDSLGKPKNVVELAEPGDWIVGTGGADSKRSVGHHKLVYAMKVERKITRDEYFRTRALACKKPSGKEADFRARGDNLEPTSQFQKNKQYVLISRKHFYYFGKNAIRIPRDKFPNLEKTGPGFRSDFSDEYIKRFEKWITRRDAGKHGDPCWMEQVSKERRAKICESSC